MATVIDQVHWLNSYPNFVIAFLDKLLYDGLTLNGEFFTSIKIKKEINKVETKSMETTVTPKWIRLMCITSASL